MRLFHWLWAGWLAYFCVVEGIAIFHEVKDHQGDGWTFTHFLSSQLPIGLRVAFIVWLAYHFIIVHKTG